MGTAGAEQRAQTSYTELSRRPLRRQVAGPAEDAAGTLSGHKCGRNPLKGKGSPPLDDKEWQFYPSKHFIPGKSFAPSLSGVLEQREGSSEASDSSAIRTSLRLSDRSYESHLAGGAVAVTSTAHVPKPMRRPGSGTPRTDRVLGVASDTAEPAQPTFALFGPKHRDGSGSSRPITAPSCILRTRAQTRAGYDIGRSAYGDVLNYRHSGGICPPQYKLSTERPAAPQLAKPAAEQARTAFFDTRSSYQVNKMRSQKSDILSSQ